MHPALTMMLFTAILTLTTGTILAGGSDETFIKQPGVSALQDLHEVTTSGEGYRSVRIPALAVTQDGTILCFAVGRRTVSDWADMDLMLQRSSDGGKTWSQPEVIVAGKGSVVDNATVIVSKRDGRVHFLYQQNYAKLFHRVSTDNGKTFSEARDVTAALEAYRSSSGYNWNVMAPGPGAGIELKSGRLVVPVWLCNSGTKAHRPSDALTVYSDDQGQTWQVGDVVARNSEQTPNPSECILLELPDGRVTMAIRNESNKYRRAVSYSADGATGWTKPEFVEDLYDPICHASMAVIPPRGERKEPLLVFLNPDSRTQKHTIRTFGARPRENFSIKVSKDGGKTWPISKVLDPGRSGYSACAVDNDGRLHVVYERGYVPGNDLNTRYFSYFNVDVDQLLAAKN